MSAQLHSVLDRELPHAANPADDVPNQLFALRLCLLLLQLLDFNQISEMFLCNELLQPKSNCCLVNELIIDHSEALGLLPYRLLVLVLVPGDDVLDLELLVDLESDHAMQRLVLLVSQTLDDGPVKFP